MGAKLIIVGQNKQGGGQSQARAIEILLVRSSSHLHVSVRERLLDEVRMCNKLRMCNKHV